MICIWTLEYKALWTMGYNVLWTLGYKALWTLRYKALRTLGYKALWTLRYKALWTLGYKVLWTLGYKARWSLGYKALCTLDYKALWTMKMNCEQDELDVAIARRASLCWRLFEPPSKAFGQIYNFILCCVEAWRMCRRKYVVGSCLCSVVCWFRFKCRSGIDLSILCQCKLKHK